MVLTEYAVCSETGLECSERVRRKLICGCKEACHGRVRERPCHEHNTALFFASPVDSHGGDLLLTDQPRKEQADVSSLLSESLSARLQVRAAQLCELRVRKGGRTGIIPSIYEDEADAVCRCEGEHWSKDAYRQALQKLPCQCIEKYNSALLTIVETCTMHHDECGV